MTRLPARAAPARALAVIGVLVALAVTGCGGRDAATATVPDRDATVLETATLNPGQDVPTPSGPTVLTVTGKIATTNAGRGLALDLATVQRLGLRKVTVFDPWVKRQLDLQGVWLSGLVRTAGTDPAATSLHLTALDSYQVDLPLTDVMAGGIFLATATGTGAPIPVDDGGPTRIVFVGDGLAGNSPDQWIWSLSTIDVR